jgi:hypothetical protein
MKSQTLVTVLALVVAGTSMAPSARSQAVDSAALLKAAGTAPAVAATPDTTKKKHGMFSKLKSVAQNKTVQSIAKTAVCTAVPGGGMMLSAVDANKNGTSTATALKNAAVAPGCMPGMPGMGVPGVPGMAGVPGVAGMGLPGGMPKGASGAMGIAAMQASAAMQTAVMNGAIARAMPSGVPGTSQAQMAQQMTQMQTAAAANGGIATEAPGQQMQLSGKPEDEIKKGKLVIKHIDWMRGTPAVSAPSMSGFVDVLHTAGDAVKESGAKYRIDVYMDKNYSDADIATLGQARQGAIMSFMLERVQATGVMVPGNIKKDKEQRVEIVKIK